MKIAGLQKCSLLDYPGKVAAVVFSPGCNLDCCYCHNRGLLDPGCELLDVEEVLGFLAHRSRLLDGVVLSGGEPTLQVGLADFARTLKGLGYCLKLDTNGTRPDVLAELLDQDLLDYVAMDLKAPWSKYDEVCGVHVDLEAVRRSTDLLTRSGIEYEFRTTYTHLLTQVDVERIALQVPGASRFVLQHCRREQAPGMKERLLQVADSLRHQSIPCAVRGV
jgi:pyruvate formate lyase activating enzyme